MITVKLTIVLFAFISASYVACVIYYLISNEISKLKIYNKMFVLFLLFYCFILLRYSRETTLYENDISHCEIDLVKTSAIQDFTINKDETAKITCKAEQLNISKFKNGIINESQTYELNNINYMNGNDQYYMVKCSSPKNNSVIVPNIENGNLISCTIKSSITNEIIEIVKATDQTTTLVVF